MSFETEITVKKEPLLSVVMAVYNSEKYLSTSIKSVLSQTYPHFELIIVNDGSIDGSESIAREYIAKDKRIVYLKNEVNAGQSATRNRAIKCAKGDYIAIVDSDDICIPSRFEKQVNFLNKNKNIDVLGS